MDKSAIFFSQLLILGAFICMATAVSLRHKRNVIAEYHIPNPKLANPEIVQFPHETTCHYYYLVLSEEDITVNKCPDGELFDYIDHKCSRKETARCWSRHFGKMKHHHIQLKSRGQFRCPYAWGKYPDIKDCTKYYVCLSGKVKHKKCAPYEHFDKISRKCVASIDGVCADKTDVADPDYKCPRTWGSFSFSKDCSKYYECLEKRPSLRTCPNDTLFHDRKEKCVPLKHVHCGSRYNPYSKKEENSSIEEPIHLENPKVILSKSIKYTSEEKETESSVEVVSEAKISTIDPNSIVIERKPLITDSPTMQQPPKDLTTGEFSSSNSQDLSPLKLNKTEVNDLKSKQSVANEIESLIDVSTDIISVNDTDENTDDDLGYTDEFIEISTSEAKTSSSPEIKTSSSPETKNSSSSETKSPSLPETKISSSPETKMSSSPETKISSLPETKISSSPETKTSSSPETKTSSSSETKTTSSSETKITSSSETKSPSSLEPKISSSPETKTSSLPEIKISSLSEAKQSRLPETKTSSSSITQTVAVDSTQNIKEEIEQIKEQQTTAESLQATASDECSPKDTTCITEESGRILRCPGVEGQFPYPEDERRFLICENSNIRIRYCPGDTIFNFRAKKCTGSMIF